MRQMHEETETMYQKTRGSIYDIHKEGKILLNENDTPKKMVTIYKRVVCRKKKLKSKALIFPSRS